MNDPYTRQEPLPDKRTERLERMMKFMVMLEREGLTSHDHIVTGCAVARLIQLATMLNKRWRRTFRTSDAQYQLHIERLENTASELHPMLTIETQSGEAYLCAGNVPDSLRLNIPVWMS